MNVEIKEKQATYIEKPVLGEQIEIIIPDCCRLGLPTCEHRIKPAKLKKQNKGL